MRRLTLALDPGKTTGWASYDHDTRSFKSGQTDFDETCRLVLSPREAFDTADDIIVPEAYFPHGQLDIVSETFIITVNTAKNTQATWSLELIGVARMVSHLYGGQPLVLQPAAAAKRLMSDDLLKALEWHKPGKGHANDAARHLGLFLMGRGWMDDRVKQYVGGR